MKQIVLMGVMSSVVMLAMLICVTTGDSQAETELAIPHGRAALENEFPFMVRMMARALKVCSGFLITASNVLTAAHCVCGLDRGLPQEPIEALRIHYLNVTGGVLNFYDRGNIHYQRKKMSKGKVAPNYKRSQEGFEKWYINDVGLGILDEPFTINEAVKVYPIDLNNPNVLKEQWNAITDKKNCSAVGWSGAALLPRLNLGAPSLRAVSLTFWDAEACKTQARDYFNKQDMTPNGMICATGNDGGTMEEGLEGSPLICDGKIVGVYSFLYTGNLTPYNKDEFAKYNPPAFYYLLSYHLSADLLVIISQSNPFSINFYLLSLPLIYASIIHFWHEHDYN